MSYQEPLKKVFNRRETCHIVRNQAYGAQQTQLKAGEELITGTVIDLDGNKVTLGTYDALAPKWYGVAFGASHMNDFKNRIKPHEQIVVFFENFTIDTKIYAADTYTVGEVVTVIDGEFAKTDGTNNYPAGIVEEVHPDYLRIRFLVK